MKTILFVVLLVFGLNVDKSLSGRIDVFVPIPNTLNCRILTSKYPLLSSIPQLIAII